MYRYAKLVKRCQCCQQRVGLADMAKAIENGGVSRTTSKQTFHVLEIMASIMKSAETGMPVVLTSHFEREAPMESAK